MAIYALDDYVPQLPPAGRYWVAPEAHVIGRVRLGLDVGIWFGAVVRADNDTIDIGEGTNIQENAMLHADPGFPIVIGAHCTVGHHAIIHGCTIGPGALIGMGVTVLNGARIGANCLVGANALVTEGKVFDDNTLIMGAPAKAVRTLDAETIARFHKDAGRYVEKLRRYAKGLRRID
ncbi:MAG TPA: gamma carbonic anhydrase family protein [Alphaproteobacteria bacterium]